jgi:hypothetical protein
MVPAGAAAELLPAQRTDPEARNEPEPVPRGDGPNSPWFDWRRARSSGTAEDGEEDGPEDEAAATAAERPSEADGTSEASPAPGSASAPDPADDAGEAAAGLRPFPWFG